MAFVAVVFVVLIPEAASVIQSLTVLAREGAVGSFYLNPVLKTIGVAYVTSFGVQICQEAGEDAIASVLELAGSWLSCLSACRFYRPSCTPCSASSASRTWSAATTFTVLLLVLLWTSVCRAQGEGVWNTQPFQDSIQAQLEALDLGQLLEFTEVLEEGYQELLPSLNLKDLVSGTPDAHSAADLLTLLARSFFGELYVSLSLLRQLVVIGILAAVLQRLSVSFGSRMVVDLAFAVCFWCWPWSGFRVSRLLQAWPRILYRPW